MHHLEHWLHAVARTLLSVLPAVPRKVVWLGIASIMVCPGCVYSSNRQAGASLGGGIGALTGAMIGQESGHPLGGALIGALAGTAVGGLAGEAQDLREERDAAVTQAQYLASTGQVLTNKDVIRMVQYGLSEEVILGTVHNTLGKYDLSPDAMIELKAAGTTDRIILALQQVPVIPPISTVGYAPSGPGVGLVVAPAPVVMYRSPRHYYYGGPRGYRRHW